MAFLPWEMQIQFWGYELQGDVADDIALLAERHKGGMIFSQHQWWDYTQEDLSRVVRIHIDANGEPVQQDVPQHWALPAVTELRMMWDRQFHEITKGLDL